MLAFVHVCMYIYVNTWAWSTVHSTRLENDGGIPNRPAMYRQSRRTIFNGSSEKFGSNIIQISTEYPLVILTMEYVFICKKERKPMIFIIAMFGYARGIQRVYRYIAICFMLKSS